MADDASMPPISPRDSGNQKGSKKRAAEKRTNNPKKKLVSANKNKPAKTEATLTVTGIIVILVEVAALVLWQLSDVFHGVLCEIIHWISIDCFIAGAAVAINKALKKPKHIWFLWIGYFLACMIVGAVIFINFLSTSSQTNVGSSTGDIKNNRDFQALETQLQNTLGQLNAVNKELIKTRDATSPRRISVQQRSDFIALLSSSEVSKIFLPVVAGNIDSETENFSGQFREMLNVAGFGPGAPLSLPLPKDNYVRVTNEIIAPIPPVGQNDFKDVIVIPGLSAFSPTNQDVDILVLVDTNTFSPGIMGTLMVFKSVHDPNGGASNFAFHPTNDPNAIVLGVCQALIQVGISVGFMPANGVLPNGRVGFFIPQKFY